jgi:hypothetical protein
MIWSQGGRQFAIYFQEGTWPAGFTLAQDIELPIPKDLPPGRYQIALGLYESGQGTRLPVTAPVGRSQDYVILHAIEVQVPAP